jgi:biotin carboxyl carrier protein
LKITVSGREYEVQPQGDTIVVDGEPFQVRVEEQAGGQRVVYVNGVAFRVALPDEPSNQMNVEVELRPYEVSYEGSLRAGPVKRAPAKKRAAAAKGAVVAAMTGRVLRIEVAAGQQIAEGDLLLILEAMKMENEVRSPQAGVIKQIAIEPGARVNEGDVLLVIDDA